METELRAGSKNTLRTLVGIWLCWAVIMTGFGYFAKARFSVARPDFAVSWTPGETRADSQNNKPYVTEPFLNNHVAWDSEYYISIALRGYDDPDMRAIPSDFTWTRPLVGLKKNVPDWISMNYAFFPFYPLAMRAVSLPFRILGMAPVGAASLAGVLLSLLGTLGAMMALYDLSKNILDRDGGLRAAFYLLIFPSSMFLAVVYTEGLFLGLSFGALALSRRGKWVPAAVLAFCATLTRAAGGFLLIPFAFAWWKQFGSKDLKAFATWKTFGTALLALAPLWAYLTWSLTLGRNFHIIETRFFSRGLLAITQTLGAWSGVADWIRQGHGESAAYYLVELFAVAAAVIVSVRLLGTDLPLALYGIAVFLFSLTSGAAQGIHRYILAMPALFLVPARLGKNPVFDRAWTLGSILVMGLFWIMFASDFWAG